MDEGSSPLARGTRLFVFCFIDKCGLIPARAGNTSLINPSSQIAWAHPRSRGEHVPGFTKWDAWLGSSPLARGTQRLVRAWQERRGLIPARAGNTSRFRRLSRVPGAHPRSRGEHLVYRTHCRVVGGSSPLARGTRGIARGFLFALVAHPRSRGEHGVSFWCWAPLFGSSPLARGTLHDIMCRSAGAGLIPARAGNTETVLSDNVLSRAHPRSRGEHRAASLCRH